MPLIKILSFIMLSFLALSGLLPSSTLARDVVSVKNIGMDLARDLANEAVLACRAKGYQVSAVVVDRSGRVRASLRDDLAAHFSLEISKRKANMAFFAGTKSGEFKAKRGDIRPELNHITGLIVMRGGLNITAGGHRVGAIGVSGAPGGDIDEACAKAALEKLAERLEFAE